MAQNDSCGNPRGYRNILLTRFSAIGDVAMTVPVVYSACRCYPDVHFIFATRPAMTAVFQNRPDNLTLAGVDLKEKYSGFTAMYRLARDLAREYGIDACIDLHNVLRTKMLGMFLRLRGIPVAQLEKPRGRRRELTRSSDKVLLPLPSQREFYSDVFARAGLPLTDNFEGLFSGLGTADPAVFSAITLPKASGTHWIGIAPFAAHAGKIYPPEKMEQVVAQLSNEAGPTHIFLFGGGEEEERILGKWAEKYNGVTSLAGKRYGFAVELALLNHIDVLLSMDSANMHLGAIAGTHTLSIWGATHPYCGFRGWRQTEDDTIQLPLECRPCSIYGNKPCLRGDYLCLNAIKPELVVSKIKEALKIK